MEGIEQQVTRKREGISSEDERGRKKAYPFGNRSSSSNYYFSAPSFNFDVIDKNKNKDVWFSEFENRFIVGGTEGLDRGVVKSDEMDKKKGKLFEKIDSSSALEGSILAEREKYNEMDKKKAELLKEAAKKSSSAAAENMVTKEFVIFKHPKDTPKPKLPYVYVRPGYYKWLRDPPDDGTPIPDPPAGYRPPHPVEKGPCGYLPMELQGRDYLIAYAFAGEAVKEYNSREVEDKIKLVKVTNVDGLRVNGYRFDLTFDAKVVAADGEEGRTQIYYASVWVKVDGTLEVWEFKLIDDGQGNTELFWNNRHQTGLVYSPHGVLAWVQGNLTKNDAASAATEVSLLSFEFVSSVCILCI